MPDDPAFAVQYFRLCGAYAEELVGSTELLGTRIEDDEVVDEF